MQILEDGSLLIAAVRASDAGRYTCIRTNDAGMVEESAYLSVLGMSYPFPCAKHSLSIHFRLKIILKNQFIH